MKKRYVLKNKKRFFTLVFTSLVLMSTLLFSNSVQGFKENEYITITVNKGDTLWDIASRQRVNIDIRKYIYEVKELNSLENSCIYEGDKLILPQYK